MTYLNHRFIEPFTERSVPQWTCPHCSRGYLKLAIEHLAYSETAASKKFRSHPDWEPGFVDYRFSANFKCSWCGEVTYCCGNAELNHYPKDEHNDVEWEEIEFFPRYFEPFISLFTLPNNCPDYIQKVVRSSFSIARFDIAAAGNRLRVAVEKLVMELNPDLTGSLDSKLKALKKSHPKSAEQLMAVKWLGNDASHDDSLRECDLAFAYKVMEAVLRYIYGNEQHELDEIVRLVNIEKGPLGKI